MFSVLAIGLITAGVYYLVFTTSGSTFITRLAISRYTKSDDIEIKKTEGSLSSKFILRDIVIKDTEWLLEGSVLGITELEVDLDFLNPENSYFKISNSTLELPGIGKFLLYGNYQGNTLDFNLYSKHINVDELLNILPFKGKIKNFSGVINDFDLYLKGSFSEPQFSGEFTVNELRRNGFTAINCPASFNLKLKDIAKQAELHGEIQFKSGKLSGNKTATVILEPSFIVYSGDPKKPSLNFKGTSYVERVKIDVALKGTFKNPDLKLSSNPSMPKEKLLIMLATGKMWRGADTQALSGGLPVGLAADFLDYFVFSGSGSQLAQKLGVKDFSVKIDSSSKGLSLKKELNGKVDVLYGAEQSSSQDSKSQTTQRVGVGYKITENISLDAEREIKQNNTKDNGEAKLEEESKVKVQFKKEF